jgi:hypothetical protein
VTLPTTTDTTPPTAPTDLTATSGSCDEAQLNWTASSDPTFPESDLLYEVSSNIGGTDEFGQTETLSFDAGDQNIKATYSVVAFDPEGLTSPPSNSASQTRRRSH